MRLKHLLILLYSFVSTHLTAQTALVTDKSSGNSISDVFIYHEDKEYVSYTDQRGMADLSGFSNGKIFLQHPSYHPESTLYTGDDLNISLKEKIVSFDEVIVSANKWEQEGQSVSQQIITVNKKEVQFQNPQTSADLLSNTGQVFVQKSQFGGGSPKIRGFAANSVLLVVDGVRMNNAIFRSGNLQNVINIDPNALESAEVVFGPGSVIYGSDALGGVMDFHTVSPKWSSDDITDFSLNALSRYSTTANEKTGHIDCSLSDKKWTFFHSSTFSSFDDLRAGSVRKNGYENEFERTFYIERMNGEDLLIKNDDINVQRSSGYDLFNTISKINYRLGNKNDITYNFYYSTTSDIPRYDNLTEKINTSDSLAHAEWYYGPQKWQMHNLKWNLYAKSGLFDQARATLAYQSFEESRNDRPFGDDRLRVRTEQVDMYSISLDFDKEFAESNLYYGIDYYHNEVSSEALRRNIETGEITGTESRYPDGGSSFSSFAVYGNYVHPFSGKLVLNGGLRFNSVNLNANTNNERALANNSKDIDLTNFALNGSLGLAVNLNPTNKISYNVSTGFRSPNIDDIGKVFDIGSSIVVPNPGLKPEYTLSNEIAYQRKKGNSFFSIVGFYSRVFDAIVDGPFELEGRSSVVVESETLDVFSKVNAGSAEVYGGSILYAAEFLDTWAFSKTITYTDGRDISNNEPLRHTTPIFGKAALTYQKNKLRTEFYLEYHLNRNPDDIPSAEFDRKPHLYTDEGTPGWHTLNLKSDYRLTESINFNFGIENILDKHYRPYTAGISAPGRNFLIAVRASLK
ncbi:MAG: TonB-dependent receptor [Ekhidna sp.]|nr:TonB-dependent receptor [Ekhidna sp.]